MNLEFFTSIRLPDILPWALPPLLGAVIGYVTNAIAIRMLFRPLTEKRILGLRIPLTPGIIPKQRLQLADSIGDMVSRELLTEEAVRRQLASEGFQVKLEQNIDSLLGDLINAPLSSLRGANRELVASSVEQFLSQALYSFFSSRSFIHGVRTVLNRVVHSLGAKRLEEVLGRVQVGSLVLSRLLPLLATADARRKIGQTLRRWLEERRGRKDPLGVLLPAELTRVLVELVSTLLPVLFDSLFQWLNREDTRAELNRRGKRLLRNILERLNMLQRFLISAGQFDRTLEQKMPEIIDEAMEHLRSYAYDPATVRNLKELLGESFENWRKKPSGEVLSKITPETVAVLVDKALERMNDQAAQDRLAGAIDRGMGRLKQRTIGELLTRFVRLPEQEVIEFLSNQVLTYLSRRETSQAIAAELVSFSRKFIEEHQQDSIAELLHIEQALQKRAGSYLSSQLIRIIDARLPAFIESFDVRRMVVEKINGLDVAQVEALLLMVIRRHLKWINIFGGILGAVIGFSQLILRLLR